MRNGLSCLLIHCLLSDVILVLAPCMPTVLLMSDAPIGSRPHHPIQAATVDVAMGHRRTAEQRSWLAPEWNAFLLCG